MRKLANIFALCALGTVMAVGCGDDDDDDGGGGTGGSGTGAMAGSDTGGSGTGGGGGATGGTAAEGVCAVQCTTATVDDDCGEDTAFTDYSCDDGFCTATPKPCNDETGAGQNCDIGDLDLFECIDVDGTTACRQLCDPDDVIDLCAIGGGSCTGEGTGDDADETFCVYPEVEPSCLGGVDVGEPCALGGLGGAGGGGGAPAAFGVCTEEGTCVCTADSECTAEGYACNN